MVTINWCRRKGTKLIEPNGNLAKEYIQTAEETLEELKRIKSKVWLATAKYYCEYFAVYAILMKIGIKCEIHECTIEMAKLLEKERVFSGYAKILEEDKQLRIDNQYYLKNRDVPIQYDELVEFVLTCKRITNTLTTDKIQEIRKRMRAKSLAPLDTHAENT